MKLNTIINSENLINIGKFLAKPIIIFLICRIFIQIINKISSNVLRKTKLEVGIQNFVKSTLKIALWVLTIILVADALGINTTSLVAILSVVSLALSLSIQNIFTNMFSGITLLLSKPFSVGDFVDISGISGTVKSIDLMRTTLLTPDAKTEFIPNGDVCNASIINYSMEPFRRVEWILSVSYDATTEKVKEAIMEVINMDNRIISAEQDIEKAPFVRLNKYNSNDIEYIIRVWVKNEDFWNVYYDINEKLRESFSKYKIEFSYPHSIIHLNIDDKR